jgi:hypothetical protein
MEDKIQKAREMLEKLMSGSSPDWWEARTVAAKSVTDDPAEQQMIYDALRKRRIVVQIYLEIDENGGGEAITEVIADGKEIKTQQIPGIDDCSYTIAEDEGMEIVLKQYL